MALVKCKECGHEVAKSALSCPQCGSTLRKKKRGFFGKLAVLLFLAFNAFMAFWLVSYWGDVAPAVVDESNEAAQAGAVIGTAMGSGLILTIWALGAVILGLMALLSRPK